MTILEWDSYGNGLLPDSQRARPGRRRRKTRPADPFKNLTTTGSKIAPQAVVQKLHPNKNRGIILQEHYNTGADARVGNFCTRADSAGYERIWLAYPAHRRYGRTAAMRAIREALNRGATLEAIEAALQEALSSEQWLKDNGRYIPSFTNWIDCETWRDYLGQTNNEEVEWT